MKRRAKIFLDVDIEGLLADTVAVSDVVNFDCYESIVSSCQRVIAQYKNTEPECIVTKKLFYYKKRARSSRMNPSQIFTTTDVFRAIAEHPSGEIPIGVQWTLKGDIDDILQPIAKIDPPLKDINYTEPPERRALRKPLVDDTDIADDDDEFSIPEKKRKIQNAQPDAPGIDTSRKQAIINLEPNSFYRNVLLDKRSTPPPIVIPTDVVTKQGSNESTEEQTYKVLKRQGKPGDAASSNYLWPDDIRCELLMKYGGITERQNLPFSLVTDILTMVKEYFSTLGHTRVNTNTGLSGPVEPDDVQAKLDEMNSAIQDKIAERKKRKHPITYIQDAKMEIFRTFSTLNLSKARFNELLDWLKSLELQEGKQGRFFLTERNKLGAGLKVHYDTDATAAQKLNEIHQMRSKLNVPKTLHPVDLNSRLTTTAHTTLPKVTQPDQVNPPFMLLMPSGNTTVPTTLTQFLPSNLKVIPQPSVSIVNGKVVQSFAAPKTVSSSKKSNIDSNKSVEPKDTPSESVKDSSKTQKSTPAILRRKRGRTGKGTEEKNDPVPLQMYKSYNRESDAEGNILYDEDLIKKEPVSYSDAEDDTKNDPDYIPAGSKYDSGISGGGKYETIKEMLRSDAVMPQADDPDLDDQSDDSFRIVTIKSEPLDDY